MPRPTKFKPEMCDTIINLMKEGASKIEVCANLDIDYQTLLNWVDKGHNNFNSMFFESIKKGELLSQAWWESQGRTNMKETKFNSTLWFMNMKNRFRKSPVPWADKLDIDMNDKTVTRTKKRFDGE